MIEGLDFFPSGRFQAGVFNNKSEYLTPVVGFFPPQKTRQPPQVTTATDGYREGG